MMLGIVAVIGLILISGCAQIKAPEEGIAAQAKVGGVMYVVETSEGIKPFLVVGDSVWDKTKIKEKTGVEPQIEQAAVPREVMNLAVQELDKCSAHYEITEWVPISGGDEEPADWLGISSSYTINNETKGLILPKGIYMGSFYTGSSLPAKKEWFLSANCICEPEVQTQTMPPKDTQIGKQEMEPREGRAEKKWPCATDSMLEERKESRAVIDEYLRANNIEGKILFDYFALYPLLGFERA